MSETQKTIYRYKYSAEYRKEQNKRYYEQNKERLLEEARLKRLAKLDGTVLVLPLKENSARMLKKEPKYLSVQKIVPLEASSM